LMLNLHTFILITKDGTNVSSQEIWQNSTEDQSR